VKGYGPTQGARRYQVSSEAELPPWFGPDHRPEVACKNQRAAQAELAVRDQGCKREIENHLASWGCLVISICFKCFLYNMYFNYCSSITFCLMILFWNGEILASASYDAHRNFIANSSIKLLPYNSRVIKGWYKNQPSKNKVLKHECGTPDYLNFVAHFASLVFHLLLHHLQWGTFNCIFCKPTHIGRHSNQPYHCTSYGPFFAGKFNEQVCLHGYSGVVAISASR
jgi:hypothetical protein